MDVMHLLIFKIFAFPFLIDLHKKKINCTYIFVLFISGYSVVAEFGKSQRGAPVLLYRGNTFVKDRQFLETINWRCALFKKLKCRARAVTKTVHGVQLVKFTHYFHTHKIQKNNPI